MPTRIALVTCAALPDLDADDHLLRDALRARGAEVVAAVWDDAAVDWGSFNLVLVRSAWDYHERRDAFLAWADRVAAVTALHNPVQVLRWNTDKTYLGEVAGAGLATVPTTILRTADDVVAWSPPTDAGSVVVKPTVSAGSNNTTRHPNDPDGISAARARLLEHIAQGRVMMAQPYLDSVDAAGETALLFFGGVFSHAIRKGPLLDLANDGARVADLYLKETIDPRTPGGDELALAQKVLASLPFATPLYARIDIIRDADGAPVVLEVELTEPSLFFAHGDGAADRLADEISALLARQGGRGASDPIATA